MKNTTNTKSNTKFAVKGYFYPCGKKGRRTLDGPWSKDVNEAINNLVGMLANKEGSVGSLFIAERSEKETGEKDSKGNWYVSTNLNPDHYTKIESLGLNVL
jgi:hypothetical protein